MMDKNIIALRIKEARKKKNMDLKTLREAVGVSQSAMSHYSTGSTVPTLEVAAKLAETLGVSLDWLCGLTEESETQRNTCGYVARLMLKAEKALVAGSSGCLRLSYYEGGNAYAVQTDNRELMNFFSKKIKFEEMAKENDEAEEMFQAWLSGALEKLDNVILKKDTSKEADDEDLPF